MKETKHIGFIRIKSHHYMHISQYKEITIYHKNNNKNLDICFV